MAFFQYLVFDGENLPLPDSYEVELEDVEADSGGPIGGISDASCPAQPDKKTPPSAAFAT